MFEIVSASLEYDPPTDDGHDRNYFRDCEGDDLNFTNRLVKNVRDLKNRIQKSSVGFSRSMEIVWIPKKEEYQKFVDSLWWKKNDFLQFQKSSISEISTLSKKSGLDRKQARKKLYSPESFSEFEDIQRDIQQQEEGGDYYEEPDKTYFNCFNDDEDDEECYYNYDNSSSSSSSNDSKGSKNRSSLKKPFTALEENKETEENSSLSIDVDVDYDDWSNFCVKLPTQPFTFGKEKVSYKRRINKILARSFQIGLLFILFPILAMLFLNQLFA